MFISRSLYAKEKVHLFDFQTNILLLQGSANIHIEKAHHHRFHYVRMFEKSEKGVYRLTKMREREGRE